MLLNNTRVTRLSLLFYMLDYPLMKELLTCEYACRTDVLNSAVFDPVSYTRNTPDRFSTLKLFICRFGSYTQCSP